MENVHEHNIKLAEDWTRALNEDNLGKLESMSVMPLDFKGLHGQNQLSITDVKNWIDQQQPNFHTVEKYTKHNLVLLGQKVTVKSQGNNENLVYSLFTLDNDKVASVVQYQDQDQALKAAEMSGKDKR